MQGKGTVSEGNFPAPVTWRYSPGCVNDAFVVLMYAPSVGGRHWCASQSRPIIPSYGLWTPEGR